jgi:hypothetical protein
MPNAYARSSLDGFNKASLATTASFRLHVSQVSFAWRPDCSASSTICSIARRALGGRLLQAATTSARSCGIDMALSLCTELQSWCNPPARVPVCESAERTVAQCTCKAGAMSDAERGRVRFPPPPPFLKSATLCYLRELHFLVLRQLFGGTHLVHTLAHLPASPRCSPPQRPAARRASGSYTFIVKHQSFSKNTNKGLVPGQI